MIVQMTMSKYLRKLLFFQFKTLVTSSKIVVLVQNILTCGNVGRKQKLKLMYFQFTFSLLIFSYFMEDMRLKGFSVLLALYL